MRGRIRSLAKEYSSLGMAPPTDPRLKQKCPNALRYAVSFSPLSNDS
jgi:hypothetical protein